MTAARPEEVVLVSDRGPVRFTERAEGLRPVRRNGSVTALLDRVGRAVDPRTARISWVAPSDADGDARAARLGLFGGLAADLGYRYEAVPVDPDAYHGYYYDAGVSLLWTAWHGIEDDVPVVVDPRDPLRSLAGYRAVNEALAAHIARTTPSGAVVACHDYQLLLLPGAVRRRRGDDVWITHFSHTPFPARESWSRLPHPLVPTLVQGMLGADVLGFQRPAWARRFLECCAVLGLDVDHEAGRVSTGRGRATWVRCYPVTVDGPALAARARVPRVTDWADRTRAGDPRAVIARVDRLDPAKNALRGFEAFGTLLDRHPDLADRVRFVACLVPSRDTVPAYRDYRDRVLRTVDALNSRHPGAVTVHHGDDIERALGVLRAHDVLLVNAVADGMNLVAQEGALVNERDGVIVLSTGTGAGDLLPRDGTVPLEQPRSVTATADALHRALTLPPERRRAMAARARAAVRCADPVDWLHDQLADVRAVRAGRAPSALGFPRATATPHHGAAGGAVSEDVVREGMRLP
ncbi:trehalose-6-phosphate synthase [Streptomyces sp. NPDC006368]|uniref:alpha,alpha-trehalose-phosphate synthase (UDP-forming) n=1 Tax=Streptomyces sp. NPDC006368 TaxID=3156760 RepID=UPI0033AFA948